MLLSRGLDHEDIEQELLMRVANASRKYDPTRGVATFDTYANAAIIFEASKLGQQFYTDKRTLPEGKKLVSLYAPLQVGNDGEIIDVLADPRSDNFNDAEAAAMIVNEGFRCLDQRYRQLLELRHGFDGNGERTLDEVGAIMGISKERARQLEEKAHQKIREWRIRQLTRKDGTQ